MPRRNRNAGPRHTAKGGARHVFTPDTPVAMENGITGEIVDTFRVELILRDNKSVAQQEEKDQKRRKREGR